MFIKIHGHYFNIRELARITRGDDKLILVQDDGRFSIDIASPEGQALIWYLDQKATDVLASYQEYKQNRRDQAEQEEKKQEAISQEEKKLHSLLTDMKETTWIPLEKQALNTLGIPRSKLRLLLAQMEHKGLVRRYTKDSGVTYLTYYEAIPQVSTIPADMALNEYRFYQLIKKEGRVPLFQLRIAADGLGIGDERFCMYSKSLCDKGYIKIDTGADGTFYEAVPQEQTV